MLRSILIGIVAGARSITPLAAVANAAAAGRLPENDLPVRLLGSPLVVAATTALAAAEMGGDKMKSAPDRIVLPGMIARVASAAIAGAALAPKRERLLAATVAVTASMIAAHLSWRARIKAMERYGQTNTGTIEDAIVAPAAVAAVAA